MRAISVGKSYFIVWPYFVAYSSRKELLVLNLRIIYVPVF
jgi:hypothetical protein